MDARIRARPCPSSTATYDINEIFSAYRRRFGDMCEEKMLNTKGTGGELVMKMIDDANNMMVVSILWLQ